MSLANILTTKEPDIQPIRVAVDLNSLTMFLSEKLPKFGLPIRKSGQFGLGQSNPTYYLQDMHGKEFVVRCKPKGPLAFGAHQIDREFWIQSVVGKQGVPVPEMFVYCKDTSVIGVEFYCMNYLKGHVYGHMGLKGVDFEVQHECWKVATHVMAQLHQLDPVALNLEKYGKFSGYYPRSIANWKRLSQQQALVKNLDSGRPTGDLALLDEQISWFKRWLPRDEVSICHFDFAFHNLMFSMPGVSPVKMVAVLDWELSTIGHPLADLGYFVQLLETPWPEGWKNVPKEEAGGIPSLSQVLEWYASARQWDAKRVTERFGYHIVWSAFRVRFFILRLMYVRVL
jgi:aminoglycoside phosphotransferase (APT) family kinase protein